MENRGQWQPLKANLSLETVKVCRNNGVSFKTDQKRGAGKMVETMKGDSLAAGSSSKEGRRPLFQECETSQKEVYSSQPVVGGDNNMKEASYVEGDGSDDDLLSEDYKLVSMSPSRMEVTSDHVDTTMQEVSNQPAEVWIRRRWILRQL